METRTNDFGMTLAERGKPARAGLVTPGNEELWAVDVEVNATLPPGEYAAAALPFAGRTYRGHDSGASFAVVWPDGGEARLTKPCVGLVQEGGELEVCVENPEEQGLHVFAKLRVLYAEKP